MQVYNKMVKKETIQSLIDENKGKKRKQSLINDLVRLDQGNSFGVKRADTLYFYYMKQDYTGKRYHT